MDAFARVLLALFVYSYSDLSFCDVEWRAPAPRRSPAFLHPTADQNSPETLSLSASNCSRSSLRESLYRTYRYTNQDEYPSPTSSMTFGRIGIELMAPTTVPLSQTTAAAPATYVITVDLFSVSSHCECDWLVGCNGWGMRVSDGEGERGLFSFPAAVRESERRALLRRDRSIERFDRRAAGRDSRRNRSAPCRRSS